MRLNLNKWKPLSKIWMATPKSSYLNFCLKMKLFTCLKSRANFCLPELPVETESGLTIYQHAKNLFNKISMEQVINSLGHEQTVRKRWSIVCPEKRCRKITEEAAVRPSLNRQNFTNSRVYHKQKNCPCWDDEALTYRAIETERLEVAVECWPLM